MSGLSMLQHAPRLVLQPVSTESFRPFGTVIEMGLPAITVNDGTAMRHDIDAFAATEVLCGFRLVTSIYDADSRDLRNPISMLERHPNSAQMIVPLDGEGHLVIACEEAPNGVPKLSTLTAFWFSARQGVIYRRGIWHHPIFALGRRTRFLVQSWRDGTDADCEMTAIAPRTIAADR
jgi:ureidoglycolate lyase